MLLEFESDLLNRFGFACRFTSNELYILTLNGRDIAPFYSKESLRTITDQIELIIQNNLDLGLDREDILDIALLVNYSTLIEST